MPTRSPGRTPRAARPSGPGGGLGVADRPLVGDHERPVGVLAGAVVQPFVQGAWGPGGEPVAELSTARLDVRGHGASLITIKNQPSRSLPSPARRPFRPGPVSG